MMMRKTCDYYYSRYDPNSWSYERIECKKSPRHIAYMKAFPRPQWLCDEHKQKAVELTEKSNMKTTFECAFKVTRRTEKAKAELRASLEARQKEMIRKLQ